ncbi:copper amine oxidase N-terminal domain-containing protein [Tissierella sp.]|uniref:copper amine oxidase N-terminal domain-containing protein n=1 Tax=Tissierella sp. TaxID=41274 RepID=UPI002858391C|nr:copper amine oxidase N-terminal domain-containing protein [Tissierella sp.]MDR7857446.1 copper amine oxidase N-terminal domain-containing protein [Tissierella sp.]
MRNFKKYIVLSMAACITLSPVLANANDIVEEVTVISAPINSEEEIKVKDYIKYEGKITSITKNEKYISIMVKDDASDPYNGMLFHIDEDVILLNDKAMDFISKDSFKEGQTVTGYYSKDTIMLMSLPAQLSPDLIILNEAEEPVTVEVSKFNKELISTDGMLKISPTDTTIITDKNGNKVDKEDLVDRDLIVFYTISTKSIPAQTGPEKIIVMDKEDTVLEVETPEPEVIQAEVSVLNKALINEKEITLDKELYKNEKDIVMVPLRQIAETLGYEVNWNNDLRKAELTKGAQWTAVTIGEDNYSFAKMLVRLGAAPEIKDSTTYVPLNFLEEILKVSVEILEDGMVNIAE